MNSKKKMGRPPAPWVHEIANLTITDSQWLDVYELSNIIEVSVLSLKAFIRKAQVKRKHEVNEGQVKAKFKVKELKKAAKEYITPWR